MTQEEAEQPKHECKKAFASSPWGWLSPPPWGQALQPTDPTALVSHTANSHPQDQYMAQKRAVLHPPIHQLSLYNTL